MKPDILFDAIEPFRDKAGFPVIRESGSVVYASKRSVDSERLIKQWEDKMPREEYAREIFAHCVVRDKKGC